MPKQVDPEQRRGELAEAAARVIARSGIDGASLRSVAAEAGWTTGALVHYFANKRELLTFTLQASLERRRARSARRSNLPPADALHASLVEGLPISEGGKLHWIVTLAFAAQSSADSELAAVQRDAYRHFRSNVAGMVSAINASGASLIDADGTSEQVDPVEEAERLIALLDGIAIQAIFDPESWPPERQRAALDAGLAPYLRVGT